MILTKEEEAMVAGQYGPGLEKCITFLIKYGKAFAADKLIKVASAHVFNAFPLDLLEDLTEGVDQAETFTTIHPFMSLCDPLSYEKMIKVLRECRFVITDSGGIHQDCLRDSGREPNCGQRDSGVFRYLQDKD